MTNEELAILAAQGDTESLHKLYFAVVPFLYKYISQYFPLCKGSIAEPEDLIQCGYFAVVEAVGYFSPEKGYKFLTYLGYCIQTACNTELGYRKKQVKTISLETPLWGDESPTIGDTIEDPDTNIYEYHELSNLQLVVRREVEKLHSKKGKIILYYKYYENKTYKEISEILGWSKRKVWFTRCAMMDKLKESKVIQELGIAYDLTNIDRQANPEVIIASLQDIGLEVI